MIFHSMGSKWCVPYSGALQTTDTPFLPILPSDFTPCNLVSIYVLFAQAWTLVCSKLPIGSGLFRTDENVNGAKAVGEGSCRLQTMPCTRLFWSGKIGVCVLSLVVCLVTKKNEQILHDPFIPLGGTKALGAPSTTTFVRNTQRKA